MFNFSSKLHQLAIGLSCLILLAGSAPLPGEVANPDLLEFLLAQVEAAREKIETARYRIGWESEEDAPDGRRFNVGSGTVKLKGRWRWSDHVIDSKIPATGWRQTTTGRVVLNDKYFGCWPEVGNALAYRDDHQSIGSMPERSRSRLSVMSPEDLRVLGFSFGGTSSGSVREEVSKWPDIFLWRVEEVRTAKEPIKYEIQRFRKPNLNVPETIWEVDPSRGFLITQVKTTLDGFLHVVRVEPEEVAPGVWFPRGYEEERTDSSSGSKNTQSLRCDFSEITVNQDIPDEDFEWRALDIGKDVTLLHTTLDGVVTSWVWAGDSLVPSEMAQMSESVAVAVMDNAAAGIRASSSGQAEVEMPDEGNLAENLPEQDEREDAEEKGHQRISWKVILISILLFAAALVAAIKITTFKRKAH